MADSWDSYDKAAERGPRAIGFKVFWTFLIFMVVVSVVLGTVGWTLGWFAEATQVAHDEFAPKAALAKYQWFIDQANAIKKMDQDIAIYKKRQDAVRDQYKGYGEDQSKWPPHIQMQYNKDYATARDDRSAVISQRNNLVRDYNAQSSKFNWRVFETERNRPDQTFQELTE